MSKHKIAILVSGTGTNAINIIEYFEKNSVADVVLVISNKTDALAVEKAQNKGVKTVVFNNESFKKNGVVLDYLMSQSVDFIVLAGFLIKISNDIIHAYPNKIVNLHPSLLPKYGGKGMYGKRVHRAGIDPEEIIEVSSLEDLMELSTSGVVAGHAGTQEKPPFSSKKDIKKFNKDQEREQRLKKIKEGIENMNNRQQLIIEQQLRTYVRNKIKSLMHQQ